MERRLFVAQRLSAMALGPLVIVHLVLILVAVRGGLTGAEILARTEGNLWWAGYYTIFVLAAAVHAPIGLRNVLREWTRLNGPVLDGAALVFAALLLVLGLRAVAAVF